MASKIKVSEATVQKLRKGTMAGNLAKAKGATPELKEALIRFYGTKRVNDAIGKGTVNKFPTTKMPPTEKPKKPTIDRGPGIKKPTPAQIGNGKDATKKSNNVKLTPNNRESRRSVPSVKPGSGPGGKNVRPTAPKGGPGAKSLPSKGQTPNQREGRRFVPNMKMSGGPGSKPRTKTYRMKTGG